MPALAKCWTQSRNLALAKLPAAFHRQCRQHQDCSLDLLYWSVVSIYFVKASLLSPLLSISIMHAHLSAFLPNGRCLLGWHIMPEVLLAASRPQGNHCSGSRKSVSSARSSSPTVLRPLLLYGAWAPRYPSLAWHMRSWETVSSSGRHQVGDSTDKVLGGTHRWVGNLLEQFWGSPQFSLPLDFFFFRTGQRNLFKVYFSISQWFVMAPAKQMGTSNFTFYLKTPRRKITLNGIFVLYDWVESKGEKKNQALCCSDSNFSTLRKFTGTCNLEK